MMFLNGIDANYVLLMERLGFKWKDENKRQIDDVYGYFKRKGVNSLRVRLWVGNRGPSRLYYAASTALRAKACGLHLYIVLFLSDRWADLYKQPAPPEWSSMDIDRRIEAVKRYVGEVLDYLIIKRDLDFVIYQVGNEIDYGICGVFARDRKRRKRIEWLKKRVWKLEARILNAAIKAIRELVPEARIALHLGKWWDLELVEAFFTFMS